MENKDVSTKDAATDTSLESIFDIESEYSAETAGSADTLRDTTAYSRRDVGTETDFPVVTSLTLTYTSAEEVEKEQAPAPVKFDIPEFIDTSSSLSDVPEPVPEEKTKRTIKPSKSRIRYISSDEKSSSSGREHKRTYRTTKFGRTEVLGDDEESSDYSLNPNLQKGNVFVYMVVPPDGGYGWFITLISFLCQVVVDGIILAIGILLPYIAKDLDIPGAKVVLVGSVQVGCYFLAGTVSSAFINKYGFRPVAIAGCLVSIAVLTIATFSTNLFMMLLFYSILGGPGLSMIWVSSQLIIGYYFEKYRPIANGVSCSGAGVGIMIFAYMNNVLVPHLGWRNVMRVHVGCLFFVLLMGLTFVEVAPSRIGRVLEVPEESDSDISYDTTYAHLTRFSRFSVKIDNTRYSLNERFEDALEEMKEPPPKPRKPSLFRNMGKFLCPCLHAYLERRREQQAERASQKGYYIRQDLMERPDLFYTGAAVLPQEPSIIDARKTVAFGGSDLRVISLEESDGRFNPIMVANTISSINISRRSEAFRRKTYRELKVTKKCPLLAYLRPTNLIHPKIRNGFNMLFDFRLLQQMEFRVLCLSAFLFPMGFNIPFVYSTARADIEPTYARLISPSIGFSNFIFRILSGVIAYRYREYTTFLCGSGMVYGGIFVFISAFYGNNLVWFQFVYAFCYGIAPAFYSTLRAIIYVRALGLDKLTNAFGLTALAMGLGVFIGTTAGGVLNDLTGSYSAAFAFAGVCIIISGLLKLILPILIKRAQKGN